MKPVFLTGFMGSGKTTLGRALEAYTSACADPLIPPLTYIDLDEEIERRQGMSVCEIFARRGETFFRRLETQSLRECAGGENLLVGCGGGTPCHSGNMEWMNANGVTVLLEASHGTLLHRLLEAQSQRPLLAGMDAVQIGSFITAKLRERAPYYGMASLLFPSDRLETAQEVAGSCALFIELLKTKLQS